MRPRSALWFSDRLDLEKEYRKWIEKQEIADCINNFIVYLMHHNLINEEKTIRFLNKRRKRNERDKVQTEKQSTTEPG